MKYIIKYILKNTTIYRFSQNFFRSSKFNEYVFVNNLIRKKKIKSIVDIGCGDSKILDYIENKINYLGIDYEDNYIKHSSNNLNHITKKIKININEKTDFAKLIVDNNFNDVQMFIVLGFFHHVDKKVVINILKTIKNKFPNAIFFSVDPVRVRKQNFFAKLLIKLDRGKFILNDYELINLGEEFNYEFKHFNFLKFPNNQLLLYRNTKLNLN